MYLEDVSAKQRDVSITQIHVTHYADYSDPCTVYIVNKCEKIDLSSGNPTWKTLPGMKEGRSCFNPCMFHDYVYLYGSKSKLIEAFSPHTDSFLPLILLLPDYSRSCVYVHNTHLVILSKEYITQFSAGPAGQLLPHFQARCSAADFEWTNSQPVLDPTRSLVFLFSVNRCVGLDMETGAQVQVFPS